MQLRELGRHVQNGNVQTSNRHQMGFEPSLSIERPAFYRAAPPRSNNECHFCVLKTNTITKWNCAKCLGMSEAVYSFFVASGNGSHWYCKDCEGQAMRAVKVDRTIEEECSKHLEGVTNRIGSVENRLEEKADLSDVKLLQ